MGSLHLESRSTRSPMILKASYHPRTPGIGLMWGRSKREIWTKRNWRNWELKRCRGIGGSDNWSENQDGSSKLGTTGFIQEAIGKGESGDGRVWELITFGNFCGEYSQPYRLRGLNAYPYWNVIHAFRAHGRRVANSRVIGGYFCDHTPGLMVWYFEQCERTWQVEGAHGYAPYRSIDLMIEWHMFVSYLIYT